MALPINILDGEGSQRRAGVTSTHGVKTSSVGRRAVDLVSDDETARKLYRALLADGAGSTDLAIDGSAPAVDFTIGAQSDRWIWILALRVNFDGTSLELDGQDFRRFGAATAANTALTNGVRLIVTQGGDELDLFIDPIVRMGQFLSYNDSWLNIKNSISATRDFLQFDFVFDVPIVLPAGSVDKLTIKIQDDLTAIDEITAFARGYQEIL